VRPRRGADSSLGPDHLEHDELYYLCTTFPGGGCRLDHPQECTEPFAPSQSVGIIRQDREKLERRFSLARWGLIPYWAKDASIGYKLINARSETVASKPAFWEAFESRRWLIPADAFYEWKRVGTAKQTFHFGLQDDSLFAFAGLWDRWKDASGRAVESCSILTTAPNSLLADVHDRMPVILSPEHYDLWLDPGFKRTEALKGSRRC
jgi:putative SOS response-associated peptidase YedK